MKTIQEIAQWVIDNRYPKNENNKISDAEMYHTLVEDMNQVLRQPPVSGSLLPLDVHNKARELSAGEFIDWWFTKKQ